jgi:HD-GYP domain-containing protein (c-di-GMP phosphodiesterase class II)
MKIEELYFPINIQTLQCNNDQSFDVYFNTGDGKMVLYCANGILVNEDVRKNIEKHDINKLYILKKDKNNYTGFVEKNLPKILKDKQVSPTIKAEVSYNSILNISNLLFNNPKAYIIKRYEKAIFHTMICILRDDEFFQHLLNMTAFDFNLYNHSINVGILSMGLTKEILHDKKEHELGSIASGYFLHDIGKCRISLELLNKKGPLSPAEWDIIKKHPFEGLKLLDNLGALRDEIGISVYQHHERYDGGGYPEGIKGDDIHIYAKICSIADVYDGMTSYRPYRKAYTTFNALKIMKKEMFQHFDPVYFEKFIKLFTQLR